jgi:polysaccharide export outer membrane protein
MQKRISFLFCSILLLTATTIFAQNDASPANKADSPIQEMQKADPQTVQDIMNAIQQGDLPGAERIYQGARKVRSEQTTTVPVPPAAFEPAKPSLFELTLPGKLRQFGYDLFNKTASSFAPPATMSVGPDYIIGPGDQFTLTLWGTTEGIYSLLVTREGRITLPKVGVVSVAGIRFGELEQTLKRHLSKYYSEFNLSVAMGGLKTLTIYVVGEVVKPGSYTVSSLNTVYGALFAAGGPTKLGTLRAVKVLRSGKVVKTIDLYEFLLKGDRSQDIKLQNEDTVFVPLIGPIAGIAGAVYRPAIYELKGQETIGDVIQTAGGIMPTALGGRLQLTRYEDNQRKVILDINLDARQQGAPKAADGFIEMVRNMDTIVIRPLYDRVWSTVSVTGTVRNPGVIQWRPDLKLKEVIDQGGLLPISDLARAEIIRLNKNFTDRQIIPIDLGGLLNGDPLQNVPLQPKDEIKVYTLFKNAEKVSVSGEVLRPGSYEIANGERLSDLLRRVGGFTKEAYPYGAVFKRADVKNSQEKNLETFITKMQSQVLQNAASGSATALTVEDATAAKAEMTFNQAIVENLKSMREQYEGRVAINITDNLDQWAGSVDDLLLKDGDSVHIPKRPQEVMVAGAVHSPSAQVFVPGLKVKDVVNQTGGYTKFAEKDQVYVLQANGAAVSGDSPSIGNIEDKELKAGDTIFVPQKIDRYAVMRFTKDIVDILFKTAVVIATITILF